MVTIDLPTAEKKRSAESKVIAEGFDISFSYDNQTFGKEISLIIYDDLQYACNATTKACISLVCKCLSLDIKLFCMNICNLQVDYILLFNDGSIFSFLK